MFPKHVFKIKNEKSKVASGEKGRENTSKEKWACFLVVCFNPHGSKNKEGVFLGRLYIKLN